MKKFVLYTVCMFFVIGSTMASSIKSDNEKSDEKAKSEKIENQLTIEEIYLLEDRIEEIVEMDKSNLSKEEKRELINEVKTIKKSIRKSEDYVVMTTGGLVLLVLFIWLLAS